MRNFWIVSLLLLSLAASVTASAQGTADAVKEGHQYDTLKVVSTKYVQKRYNIFFKKGSSRIDHSFQGNDRVLDRMQEDIRATFEMGHAVTDSLLILSTASPDGSVEVNRRVAEARVNSTKRLILQMFPEFREATILTDIMEENWDGLRQLLRANPDFPQCAQMLSIIENTSDTEETEAALRECEEGWNFIVENHFYVLRNSSITLCVVLDGVVDEFVRLVPVAEVKSITHTPTFETLEKPMYNPGYERVIPWRKTILAARTNLLLPAMNFGVEIPIKDRWSIGADYYFPWISPKSNKWCLQLLGGFVDVKYWFPGKNKSWDRTSRLKGHAVGLYAGIGMYDLQFTREGSQGEYMDFGVDYTYSLPIARDLLRLEFNIGLGFIRTQYRPYYLASDYSDLIAVPGVKYNSTSFFGPTRAGVSLVLPITVRTKMPKEYRVGGEK